MLLPFKLNKYSFRQYIISFPSLTIRQLDIFSKSQGLSYSNLSLLFSIWQNFIWMTLSKRGDTLTLIHIHPRVHTHGFPHWHWCIIIFFKIIEWFQEGSWISLNTKVWPFILGNRMQWWLFFFSEARCPLGLRSHLPPDLLLKTHTYTNTHTHTLILWILCGTLPTDCTWFQE